MKNLFYFFLYNGLEYSYICKILIELNLNTVTIEPTEFFRIETNRTIVKIRIYTF